MPTKRLNERYIGAEMRVPISEDGQVAAYVWPHPHRPHSGHPLRRAHRRH